MNNKTIATLSLVSFAIIFLAGLTGDMAETFYAIGALGTLIFGGLVLSKLYQDDHTSKFPFIGGSVMLGFWIFNFIAPGGIALLAVFYLAFGLYGAGKLYRI